MTTTRVQLLGNPTNRNTNTDTDQRFVNCFPEISTDPITSENKTYLIARDGLNVVDVNNHTAITEIRGGLVWNNAIYWIGDNTVYKGTQYGTGNTVSSTSIGTITTSTGSVGFVAWKAATDYLVLLDGTKGYYISTADAITEITDVDFPTPHLPCPVVLDQYLFVQKTTGEIYNCDVGDLTSWAATSYLTPESYPDGCVGIARQDNLLVSLGTNSVEFFYDAANPTPGSPLGKYQQSILQYGCASFNSVSTEEGTLIFVARSETGEKFVVSLDATKDSMISTPVINRVVTNEHTDISSCYAFVCRMAGHKFYVLQLPSQSRTLVYDLETKYWHEWESDIFGTGMTPVQDSFEFKDQIVYLSSVPLLGAIIRSFPDYYQDINGSLNVLVQTTRMDFDTTKIKFIQRAEIIGDFMDLIEGTYPISMSWSDDDYQTWSTPRTSEVTGRMLFTQLGSTRRRAFRIFWTLGECFLKRINALEIDFTVGTH